MLEGASQRFRSPLPWRDAGARRRRRSRRRAGAEGLWAAEGGGRPADASSTTPPRRSTCTFSPRGWSNFGLSISEDGVLMAVVARQYYEWSAYGAGATMQLPWCKIHRLISCSSGGHGVQGEKEFC